MKPPAFQFYAADFLVGTAAMTAEEVGAYIRLLCYQWDTGSVPDDDLTIQRLTGCQASAVAKIRAKFVASADGLKNARLEAERAKQRQYREKQAANGAKRWVGNANPQGLAKPVHKPRAVPKACSPSSSPSSGTNTLPGAPAVRERNINFDALCVFEGIPLDQVGGAGGRIAKALQTIKLSTPDVTPAEIIRRGANYRTHFSSDIAITANALASHWGKCHQPRKDEHDSKRNDRSFSQRNDYSQVTNHNLAT